MRHDDNKMATTFLDIINSITITKTGESLNVLCIIEK